MSVFDLLESLEINDCLVKIPAILSRADYEKVNEVLEILGGKWVRKSNGHVFSYNPTLALQEVISSKTIPPKNPHAFFPTPDVIIADMLAISNLNNFFPSTATVLESSIGDGAIARYLRKEGFQNLIVGYEIDAFRASIARKIPNVVVYEADFLTAEIEQKFDYALINPPFSLDGNSKAYIDFVYKTWDAVEEGGKLVAVVPSGFLTASHTKIATFKEFVFEHGVYYLNPKEAFKASGTLVSTCLIYLEKRSAAELNSLFNQSYAGYPNFFIYMLELTVFNDNKLCNKFYSLKPTDKDFDVQIERLVLDSACLIRSNEGWMPYRKSWLNYFKNELVNL